MRVFLSGGSAIAETGVREPDIMLSYFVVVKDGKPDGRLRRLLAVKKKEKKRAGQPGGTARRA